MMHDTAMTVGATDVAALTVDGPQPVWMTLNDARGRAFTGELVFEADPEVHAYLDNGIVYYAERVSDVPLGRRLLEAGVVDMIQLERGTVRVGDIEHLGRLFDRDPSIDRDAVVVFAEVSTEDLITDLANRSVARVRVTAYRHHPSGVHRWFAAPLEAAGVTRPVSAVAQLDTAVIDQLPGLTFGSAAEELTIEWADLNDVAAEDVTIEDVDVPTLDEPGTHDVVEAPTAVDLDAFELSLDLAEFPDDENELDDDELIVAVEAMVEVETMVEVEAVESIEFDLADIEMVDDVDDLEFSVVWPDGSEEPVAEAISSVDDEQSESTDEAYRIDVDAVAPALTQNDDGDLQFVMPPLTLSDEPELAEANIPDDVADAVRRAIAAIESASVPTPRSSFEMHDGVDGLDRVSGTPLEPTELVEVASSGFAEFAPPTLATSVEVLYGQLAGDDASVAAAAPMPTFAPAFSTGGSFDEDSGNRSSALRRLIGSLRRKDY